MTLACRPIVRCMQVGSAILTADALQFSCRSHGPQCSIGHRLCSKVLFLPISVTRRACLNVRFRALAGLRWMTVMGAIRPFSIEGKVGKSPFPSGAPAGWLSSTQTVYSRRAAHWPLATALARREKITDG